MLKPYENYKTSGVAWIGDVPENWTVKKLKFNARIQFSNVDKISTEGEEKVRLCNYVDVYKNDLINDQLSFMEATASQAEIEKFSIQEGDIIITKDSESVEDIAVPAYVTQTIPGVLCGYHLAQIKANPSEILPKYLFRLFQSKSFNTNFEANATGMTRYGLSVSTIKNVLTLFPPPPEQQAIVRFLDYKIEQIETFVRNRQAQIRLLREQRQALINRAVSQGVRPNVKTKPSGFKWIGKIPAHWEVRRLKFLTKRITNGFVGPTRDILKGSGVRYIQALHVKQNTILFNEPYYVSEAWSLQHPRSILQAGDLVITQTGAYTGDVSIIPEEFEGANCHALIILKPDRAKVIPQYLLYVLSSHFGQSLLYSIRTGSMHPHLNSTIVCDISLPYVSDLTEQQAIIDYIKTETGRLDELMEKYKKQIGYMAEYKTALISQAVTGKIDVRDWQPPATQPMVRSRSNFTENVLVEEETP